VQIGFSVTVNNPPNLTLLTPAPRVATQGSVTGSFGAVNTDDPDVGGGSDSTETPIDLFDVKFDSLTSSLNPSTPADPVTYTATISVDTALQTPPVGTVPTGSITFRDNGVDIGTCTNVAISGAGPWTAQCTIAGGTYVGGSSHPITAKYNGSGNFDTLVSGTLTQNVVNCGNPAIVTKIADTNDGTCDADCSLREAIATVCSGGTVQFDTAGVFATPQTITLSLGELSVPANMTINGPDAAGNHVSVSGGGASRVFKINSGKTVTIRELSITGGSTAANGAGIWNDHGILTLINLDINSNTSTSAGGGVYNDATAGGTATLNVFSSTLSSNNAFEGGALYNYATGGGTGTVNVVNSTVSGNNANGPGGGLSALETGGTATVTIINSTITNNRADNDNDASGTGGGIFNAATFILHNTIVAGNFNEDGVSDSNDDINGTAVSAASSNNLIGDAATAGGLTDTTNGNIVGVGGSGTRAIGTILDTTLANNGGLTLTHKLVGGSVAIEAGSNANLPADTFDLDGDADTAETLPVDQRGVGYPRNADSADADAIQTVDIGAYELHPTIEDITDKTTAEDTALPGFAFNIGDGTGALITSVTATSSNTTVVPNLPANIS
jgi:CSLREA domain-containing protein